MTHIPQGSQKGSSFQEGHLLSYEMRVGIIVMWPQGTENVQPWGVEGKVNCVPCVKSFTLTLNSQ